MTQSGTTSSAERLRLAADFPVPSRADWQRLVAGVLSKSGRLPEEFTGDPASLLAATTYDGIEIMPLYTRDDASPSAGFPGLPPFVRGARPEGQPATGWDVRALHEAADPAEANDAILADLEGGVRSVWLRGIGPDALPGALCGVYLDLASVVLDPGDDYLAAADELTGLAARAGIAAGELSGAVGADPIGFTARTGVAAPLAPAAELAAQLSASHPNLRAIVVDALPYHQAGGSDSQELGAAIATGSEYLRELTSTGGMSVPDALAQLEFRLASTADQFLTIAKFRAARRLWARVAEVSGAPAAARGMRQHAVTSPAMLTRRDPWVNLLRTCVASFAAGIGGADAVTVLPFDTAIGVPDAFARRIARNTQSILLEEARLAGVIDPAGGSWYVERLTDELAEAAWREFAAIEREGGIMSTVESGALAGRLAETWRTRSERIAARKDPITGVSEFPFLDEKPVTRARRESTVDGGLPVRRYAEPFEELRDRSDAHLAEHGARPSIFLATVGPLAEHTARASFAANLFAAGGIEPVNPGAVGSTGELVAAYRDSGARIACLCGTDAGYAGQAAEIAERLREAGAESLLLAGKSGEYPGISGFVHAGCDVVAVLRAALDTLGVK